MVEFKKSRWRVLFMIISLVKYAEVCVFFGWIFATRGVVWFGGFFLRLMLYQA